VCSALSHCISCVNFVLYRMIKSFTHHPSLPPSLLSTHTHTHIHRYLLIEGNSELAVRQARREFQRILDEETLRVGARPQFGRYSVL